MITEFYACVFVILMLYCVVCAIAAFTSVSLLCIFLLSCKALIVFNKLTYIHTSFQQTWLILMLLMHVNLCDVTVNKTTTLVQDRCWHQHFITHAFTITQSIVKFPESVRLCSSVSTSLEQYNTNSYIRWSCINFFVNHWMQSWLLNTYKNSNSM